MKKKMIFIAILFCWLAAGIGVGTLTFNLFKSLTDFITIKDIIACYFFPLLIFGFIAIHILFKIDK